MRANVTGEHSDSIFRAEDLNMNLDPFVRTTVGSVIKLQFSVNVMIDIATFYLGNK
jgi:hypothetical protein